MAVVIEGAMIPLAQMAAQIGAIRLEEKGLRMSRGGSITQRVKVHYGFKGNRAKVLAQLKALYAERLAAYKG